MASFSGDDANSTDVVLEMNVEIDGQWGPYLLCNPLNTSEPTGPWFCVTHEKETFPPNYPGECAAHHIDAVAGICIDLEPKAVKKISLEECCMSIPNSFNHPLHLYDIY